MQTTPHGDSRVMRNPCKATTKAGKPCRAAAGRKGLCFLHANPKIAAELGRRGGRKNRRFPPPAATPLSVPKTAQDVAHFLGEAMAAIRAQRLDPKTGATLAYLGAGLLKAIEVSELDRRIEKLEALGAQAQKAQLDSDKFIELEAVKGAGEVSQ